jgi:hypothetical protein
MGYHEHLVEGAVDKASDRALSDIVRTCQVVHDMKVDLDWEEWNAHRTGHHAGANTQSMHVNCSVEGYGNC